MGEREQGREGVRESETRLQLINLTCMITNFLAAVAQVIICDVAVYRLWIRPVRDIRKV